MSPTVFQAKGYRFFFFSREELRMHVQVVSAEGEPKFWLEPTVRVAKNYRYNARQIAEIKGLIGEHYHEIVHAWQRHFGS